eukprot:32127_1
MYIKNVFNLSKLFDFRKMLMLAFVFLLLIDPTCSNHIECITYCAGLSFICNQNEPCTVTCTGEYSCYKKNITCPSGSHACVVNIDGSNGFREGYINSSLMDGGHLLVSIISGEYAMYASTIDCPLNGHCNITDTLSSSASSLQHATIKANPSTRLLYISVSSNYALQETIILCPHPIASDATRKNCIIDTDIGESILDGLTILSVFGSINVLLTRPRARNVLPRPRLLCTRYFDSFCFLGLDRDGTDVFECLDSTSVCYQNNSASLSSEISDPFILCLGTASCEYTFPSCGTSDCYIFCGGYWSCASANFQCAATHCHVIANGMQAMLNANVDCQFADNVMIHGYGSEVLSYFAVTCPSFPGTCDVTVSGGGYQMMKGVWIFGIEYISDFHLSCEYERNFTYDCFDLGTPDDRPQMLCKDNYVDSCWLEILSGFDGFECFDMMLPCSQIRPASPTVSTTLHPTSTTSEPTYGPTTVIPTHSTATFSPSEFSTSLQTELILISTASVLLSTLNSDHNDLSTFTKAQISVSLWSLIGVFCVVDAVLIGLCVMWIITKLRFRVQLPGNSSWKHALKQFGAAEYLGIVVELFDIITDYLFAADLIVRSMDSTLMTLGWISLIVAIFGVIMFYTKYVLMKKLWGYQRANFTRKLSLSTDQTTKIQITQEIRIRTMDICVISLLNSCVEDIPQTLIVSIVLSNVGIGYISIASLSLSILSFCLKLLSVIMSQCGCKDIDVEPRMGHAPKTLEE